MKHMLLKRNLLQNVTIISSFSAFLCILLNYVTNISLITGICFPLYIASFFIMSVFGSFKLIQRLISLNRPITCDIDTFVKENPHLSFLKHVLPVNRDRVKVEWKEYDTNELSVISTVLERKLVSSWYVPYISQEISFPFACKQMLDQMIGKTFQICSIIDSKEVFVDVSAILITHLNEYKKALKRHQKTPTVPIETLYKKSHAISQENKKYTSVDHCTNILRIMIKQLLPWELWDTPHSELLVRILSKKLDTYIDNTIADPVWINDRIVTYLTGKEYIDPTKKVEDIEVQISKETDIEPPSEPEKEEEVVKTDEIEESKPLEADVKSSPVMRQKRGRQGRNEVKIYDRIIEGSVKTWETDMDLQCISLGQDLLASLDGEITLSRLWGHEEPDASPERANKSPQPLWFGEEDMEIEVQEPPGRGQSPKATEAILKDIQSTVSQAKTKIGDLQVRDIDLAKPSDEAAGMMEGLLDFGIAGLKKGLRFTGLSDDSQDKSPSHPRDKGDKSPPHARAAVLPLEHSPQLHGKDEATNGVPILTKQQRVLSQDSVPLPRAQVAQGTGFDSPEPQYEEAADLSTSIAKLRCLLRQRAEAMPRTDAMPRSEDVWWDSAEETRGRTQSQPSARPVDTATLADEFDMNMERNTSPNQMSNNMQRLDKLFHRTVTGVFNSLKTAVGAEDEAAGAPHAAPHNYALRWQYVAASPEINAGCCAGRAVSAARLARVDAALEPQPRAPPAALHPPDDLEEWVCVSGRASGAALCALAASGLATPHVGARATAAILAEVVEEIITLWLEQLSEWVRARVFSECGRLAGERTVPPPARPVDAVETRRLVLDKLPALVLIFGESSVSESVDLSLRSLSHKSITKDVVFRALDLMLYRFKSAHQANASFDNN